MTARPDFADSPRPPLPIGTLLACVARDLDEMRRCSHRAETSFRAYVRCSTPTWRWLFLPRRPPIIEDDGAEP